MFENHYHNEIEIYFLISGQRYYFIENGTHLVMPGNLVIIREYVPHKVFSAGYRYFERYLLNVSRAFIGKHFDPEDSQRLFDIIGSDKFIYRLKTPAKIENIFHKMAAESLEHPKDAQKLTLLRALTVELLTEIKEIAEAGSLAETDISYVNKNILQIAGYINKYYSEKITLDFLAEKFSLSKYYLCKLFKNSFGLTFSSFLNHVRIIEAKKLLETTSLSVSEIAKRTGYSDITYFSRVFKKVMGTSALKLRKSLKKQ